MSSSSVTARPASPVASSPSPDVFEQPKLPAKRPSGAHALCRVNFSQSDINVDEYLPRKLQAFSMPNPGPLTRLKKNFVFSRPVVSLVHKRMGHNLLPQEPLSEFDVTQLLGASTSKKRSVYNIVVTSTEMSVGKADVSLPKVNWLLGKHVSLANYSDDVRFAGEMWQDEKSCIHFNARSGTYTPTDEDLENMLRLARRMFPTLNLQADQIIFHSTRKSAGAALRQCAASAFCLPVKP